MYTPAGRTQPSSAARDDDDSDDNEAETPATPVTARAGRYTAANLSPEEALRAQNLQTLRERYPATCGLHRDGGKHGRCYVEPGTNEHICLNTACMTYWADAMTRREAGVTAERPPNHAMFDAAHASRRTTTAHAPTAEPDAHTRAGAASGRPHGPSLSPTALRNLMALQQQQLLIQQQQQQQYQQNALAQYYSAVYGGGLGGPPLLASAGFLAQPGLFAHPGLLSHPLGAPPMTSAPAMPTSLGYAPPGPPTAAPAPGLSRDAIVPTAPTFDSIEAFWAAVDARHALGAEHLTRAKTKFADEGIMQGSLAMLTDADLESLGVGRFHRAVLLEVIRHGPKN